ncbi:MAG: ankyrin repeat domain-containing protein [Spirochaetia bacterium]|nr:ankyrin repeat domain-containing protein [Spirochaetia bacterium]
MPNASQIAASFLSLIHAIAEGEEAKALKLLRRHPSLALETEKVGATRTGPTGYFFKKISHYLYAGDTALHLAASAFQISVIKALLGYGADPRAKNRRGAEPLHYAVDGGPGAPHWNDREQQKTIALLLRSGAEPNATDKGGTTPLHRAVRNRCSGAVRVLLARGANARMKNGGGSTPLHLARQTTGRGGTGTPEAKKNQERIVEILTESI